MKRKLILFDIDGTLILTGGMAAGLMAESVSAVLGHPIQWAIRDFVGNTDHSILSTLLRRNGATEPMLEELVHEALVRYLRQLQAALKKDGAIQILPGVLKLLKTLKTDHRFALGLLTGNVREGARIKLRPYKLFDYFPVGAFGDDALHRNQLPGFAIQRAEKYYQCFFDRTDIWIVGDSVNDIKCAQANHLRSLAVATGHEQQSELETQHPSMIVPNLKDTNNVVEIFLH